MRQTVSIFFVATLVLLGAMFWQPALAKAQKNCLCYDAKRSNPQCVGLSKEEPNTEQECTFIAEESQGKYSYCNFYTTEAICQSTLESVNAKSSGGALFSGLDCKDYKDGSQYLQSTCGSVTVFFILAFNIINYIFGIIGAAALLYFIYGGFILILSQGNGEKVEQGKAVIMAAVLGICIAFGGYALVKFAGTIAGISSEYQLK